MTTGGPQVYIFSTRPSHKSTTQKGRGLAIAKIRETRVVEREAKDEDLTGEQQAGEVKPAVDISVGGTGEQVQSIPLLPDVKPEDVAAVTNLEIWRQVPYRGFLGETDIDTTLSMLKARWGGKKLLVKAITIGHKYVKGGTRTIDIDEPPRTPEDVEPKPNGYNPDFELIKDGLLGIDSKLDGQKGDGGPTSLMQLFLTKSETEKRLAELQVEQSRVAQEARIQEMELKQKDERSRYDKEMELRKHELDSKMELEKQRLEVEKQKIESERLRLEKDAKEERDRWERKIEADEKRRAEDLERIENQRKFEMDRLRQEAAEKSERDQKFYTQQTESQQRFQAMMAQLSKGNDATDRMMQVLQMGIEMGGGNGDTEEKDPMSKVVGMLPDALNMIMSARNGTPALPPAARPPALRQPSVPAVAPAQNIEVSNRKSRRGGNRGMRQPASAAAKPAQGNPQGGQPPWVAFLSFSLRYFSVELIGDAVLELYDEGVLKPDVLEKILGANEDIAKIWLKTKNEAFTHPAVFKKLLAVRDYMATELQDEGEEDTSSELGEGPDLGFESPAPNGSAPEPAAEKAPEGAPSI